MADNVGYTPGVGAIIAADDIGGALYQRVKIGIGSDGVASDLSSNNPMPVSLTSSNTQLSVEISNPEEIVTPLFNLLSSPMGYDKTQQRIRGFEAKEKARLVYEAEQDEIEDLYLLAMVL